MRLSINIFSLFYLSVVLFVRSFVRSFVRWFVRILLFTCSLVVVIPLSLGAQNIVVAAVASTFTTLDPYDANDALSLAVVKSFYEGLFGIDNNMKIKPVLATSYEVSKDGLAYTINLRKGVKFHDGTDFNAQAVKVNLERAINPESRLKRSSLFNSVARIEVLDEHRVRIVLHEPYSAFINVLAHPAAVMISPAALNKYGNKQIGFNPVGTGPFIFEHWSATDSLRVKKFDGYYKKGLPKVDGMVFKPVVENNTRAAMIQTGEAHFAFTIPYEQAKILEKNPNLTLVRAPSITERYIAFNVLQSPFNDVRVRQAINYAINKEALIKVAFAGYATPATGVLPPGIEFSKNYGAWAYDPVKARELLKEAGYPNGFASTLWSSHNSTTAQKVISFVQQQLSQVGINVSLEALETGQRVSRIEGAKDPMKSDLRMFYVGWSASTADVNFALTPLLATQSWPPKMFNVGYYSNPKVDLLLKDALKTTDKEQKKKIYEEAQDLIMADVPWAFLVVDELLYVHSKKLKGMYVIMDTSFNFEEVELIK